MIDFSTEREILLDQLTSAQNKLYRNKLGQFATPNFIAEEITSYALQQIEKGSIRFLEPGFGTGSFFNNVLNATSHVKDRRLVKARGYEIDKSYQAVATLYNSTVLDLINEDFTHATPEPFDLILCNPPYVRHHHIEGDQKRFLQNSVETIYGIKLSGLSGLYNYFMILGERWLSDKGIAAWLVPSEFLDVNYGVEVKRFLMNHVTLTKIHLYATEDLQFKDALVSSTVVFYKKRSNLRNSTIEVSYGGSLLNPIYKTNIKLNDLDHNTKWSRLLKSPSLYSGHTQILTVGEETFIGDFFDIKRGIATGNNKFFILSQDDAQALCGSKDLLTPILPSPRYLKTDVIQTDENGLPTNIDVQYLLNCREPMDVLKEQYSAAWAYLQNGIGTTDQKYLCKSRKMWYLQEFRKPAPILCTYMGRGRNGNNPFRFILNKSNAIATNSYIMLYPKPFLEDYLKDDKHLINKIWQILSEITINDLVEAGRTYGGGLEKIEPSELGKVPISRLKHLLS